MLPTAVSNHYSSIFWTYVSIITSARRQLVSTTTTMQPNRQGVYGFLKNTDVQPLLKSEIRGLANIQDRLTGATVVAFDMEGVNQHSDG